MSKKINETKFPKEKKKILPIIITILLCMLIFMPVGICIGPTIFPNGINFNDKKDENIEVNKENIKEDEEVEIDTMSENAKQAMESFEKLHISEAALYSTNYFNIEQISDVNLIESAIKQIKDIPSACANDGVTEKIVTIDELNNELKNIIKNKQITIEMVKAAVEPLEWGHGPNLITYKVSGDKVLLSGPCDYMGYFPDTVDNKIVKVTESKEKVYIYSKNAFRRYDLNSPREEYMPPLEYYKTYEGHFVERKEFDENLKNDEGGIIGYTEPNWDLYNTYKYTFEKTNNKYYFTKVELIK